MISFLNNQPDPLIIQISSSSSSSSVGATTLDGFWPALRFHSTIFYLYNSLQFLTFIFFKSSSTWSSHLSLGLPTGLDEHVSHSVSFLTVLVVSILITCATQRNLCIQIYSVIKIYMFRASSLSIIRSSLPYIRHR